MLYIRYFKGSKITLKWLNPNFFHNNFKKITKSKKAGIDNALKQFADRNKKQMKLN